ncbi:hypothetical protein ZWY2020_020912 [Hordeum vulgare]|nr:hypothetical protein ZWY2020_020912 [Hordeum vulgare]
MCSDISDWNSELILQFYATLHISGNPEDINTWVFDWMTQNTHYKAPASELLRELPVPIPSDATVKFYGERELPNGMMEVLMKPLAAGKSSRTTFLVHELKYTPRSVYRILCSVLAPIKGHDDEEDVVGLMKNILFNIIHGIPINIHDFFLRTLADNAMCPFDHKIYAPWIMRFIRTRTGMNFHADCQNHVGYMPPIWVNKKTFEPIEGKGKSVIEEGSRPLDGQFREPVAYSAWDDTQTRPASPVPPRVLNTRELLLSLHQKVDRNHKWVKRQFGAIVKTLTETQNSVKINHHYLHKVFDRTWATLAHLKTQTELEEMDFERDFDWLWPPKKKFRPIPVPDLEDSSFSSFRIAESDEEQLDTATGPGRRLLPRSITALPRPPRNEVFTGDFDVEALCVSFSRLSLVETPAFDTYPSDVLVFDGPPSSAGRLALYHVVVVSNAVEVMVIGAGTNKTHGKVSARAREPAVVSPDTLHAALDGLKTPITTSTNPTDARASLEEARRKILEEGIAVAVAKHWMEATQRDYNSAYGLNPVSEGPSRLGSVRGRGRVIAEILGGKQPIYETRAANLRAA